MNAPGSLTEVIDGKIYQVSISPASIRQVRLLQWQLQRHLGENFEVRSHAPLKVDSHSELKPAIAVSRRSHSQSGLPELTVRCPNEWPVQWVLDIQNAREENALPPVRHAGKSEEQRRQLYAQARVADYWHLKLPAAELRTYCGPQPDRGCYSQHELLQAGDRASPASLPQIAMQVSAPLPLHFLTRTLAGQRAYPSTSLPLQILQSTSASVDCESG